MATAYNVKNGIMVNKTTTDEIKTAGLKRGAEINVSNRNAVKFVTGCPTSDAPIVLVYEAPGDDFTGQRI